MTLQEASILVVDDEPELLEIFVAWLSDAGCPNVVCADNGEVALPLILAGHFHLIISDLNMPKLSGLGLLRQLLKTNCTVPVILFLSGANTIDKKEMKRLGVKCFLAKPIRRAELIRAAETVLREE